MKADRRRVFLEGLYIRLRSQVLVKEELSLGIGISTPFLLSRQAVYRQRRTFRDPRAGSADGRSGRPRATGGWLAFP